MILAFCIEFEHESKVSLPMSANALRVLGDDGVRVRDLPQLTGVSKEAISMSLGFLASRGYVAVVVEPGPTDRRSKVARLTPKGRQAQDEYHRLLDTVEGRWRARFGSDNVGRLREILEHVVGEPTRGPSLLWLGMEPYADGWRASRRKPVTLPHYPMVLHRGGFPDGS